MSFEKEFPSLKDKSWSDVNTICRDLEKCCLDKKRVREVMHKLLGEVIDKNDLWISTRDYYDEVIKELGL